MLPLITILIIITTTCFVLLASSTTTWAADDSSSFPDPPSSIQLETALRKGPSKFASATLSSSSSSTTDRNAKDLGYFEENAITRTDGSNCKQTPTSSHDCDMCCNGKCCEDPQFWTGISSNASLGEKNTNTEAQAWIPVRVVYITPFPFNLNSIPSDTSVKSLIGKVNEAFYSFPFRFLFNESQIIQNSTLQGFCQTDPCFTDPNCGYIKEIIPTVAQRNDNEIVLTVCHGISYLGEAQFPWAKPSDQYVQLQLANFLGAAIAHELGHYVGLMHTFQGSCDSQGDWVADTAPAGSSSLSCGSIRDSCTSLSGNDDTRNFMNYGLSWTCGMGFTTGQVARAKKSMEYYRPNLVANTRVKINANNNPSFTSTQTPGCKVRAETFSDCWCENPQLNPASWCQETAADGSLFTQAPPSSLTTPTPIGGPPSGAGKMEIALLVVIMIMIMMV